VAWVTPMLRASWAVLVRLPLCPSASEVWPIWRCTGWALAQLLEPVVEYRTCPTPMWPSNDARSGSENTWATSPLSLKTVTVWPSEVAIPADSCPRCWRANRPKYTVVETWVPGA
jgi:hypothetical protein